MMMKSRRGHFSNRIGGTLIVALVAVTVTSAICVSLVRLTVLKQRQHLPQLRSAQAELLAEAALKKAAFELAANADYNGEVWSVSIDDVSEIPSSATIAVSEIDGETRNIKVIARVPATGDHRAQRTITRQWQSSQ